jgi:hypothetical protein
MLAVFCRTGEFCNTSFVFDDTCFISVGKL